MPTPWNGKFMGVGNNGANGEIAFTLTSASLASAINRGYAAAGTDTGHASSPVDGSWAVDAPEKIIDNAERSIVEMTAKAKAIITAFYGTDPAFSYFFGCSMGGRQGLLQASSLPKPTMGSLPGAPALDLPNLTAAGAFQAQQLSGAGAFPASKLRTEHGKKSTTHCARVSPSTPGARLNRAQRYSTVRASKPPKKAENADLTPERR